MAPITLRVHCAKEMHLLLVVVAGLHADAGFLAAPLQPSVLLLSADIAGCHVCSQTGCAHATQGPAVDCCFVFMLLGHSSLIIGCVQAIVYMSR